MSALQWFLKFIICVQFGILSVLNCEQYVVLGRVLLGMSEFLLTNIDLDILSFWPLFLFFALDFLHDFIPVDSGTKALVAAIVLL